MGPIPCEQSGLDRRRAMNLPLAHNNLEHVKSCGGVQEHQG